MQERKALCLTLCCMASFWLTSWERRISTSSFRTSSSSLEEFSWSSRTVYAGEPGAAELASALPLKDWRISFKWCLSFLFSDSNSWRWRHDRDRKFWIIYIQKHLYMQKHITIQYIIYWFSFLILDVFFTGHFIFLILAIISTAARLCYYYKLKKKYV